MVTPSPTPLLISFLFFLFTMVAHAMVPASRTFTHVNQGEFGPYVVEYDANYRYIPFKTDSRFQLCFYNTTPGVFYFGLLMGIFRTENIRPRWIWEANRGRPVSENATLSLRPDGDFVLSDADGSVVWSTGTANRGVVGLDIRPNGNVVLYDGRGRLVWQSFDHPTDTLLVGQSLRAGGPRTLVSRASAVDGSFGIYSFVMETESFTMYVNNSTNKPIPYFNGSNGVWGFSVGPFISATLECGPETEDAVAYELTLAVSTKLGDTPNTATIDLARPKYNATLSFLRLEPDGNLVAYTYYDPVEYRAWERTFAFFSDQIKPVSGCALPSKCGALGVCEDEMCVACPTPKGLRDWSKRCRLPAPGACGGRDYYKVVGVENFLSSYVEGKGGVGVEECKKMCSSDCKCVGFLYWEESSKCWLAPLLGTLTRVSNSSHVAYIKAPNKKPTTS